MIDLKRRSFLFGVAATVVLPPERTFHILQPPKLIVEKRGIILPGDVRLFDLPTVQSCELARKLLDGTYKVSDVPRWVVLDQRWYDAMVRQERT
jgi:hypothetical protein